jgi:hypothetical protein
MTDIYYGIAGIYIYSPNFFNYTPFSCFSAISSSREGADDRGCLQFLAMEFRGEFNTKEFAKRFGHLLGLIRYM